MKKYIETIKQYHQLLSTYLLNEKKSVLLLVLLVLLHTALQLAIPQMTASFIDKAVAKEPLNLLIIIGVSFITVSIISQSVRVVVETLGVNLGWKCTNSLRNDVVLKCTKMEMNFHNENSAGEMIERIDGDIERLLNFFSQFSVLLITHTLLLIGILFILYMENIIIGIVTTLFVILSLITIKSVRKLSKPFWEKYLESNSNLFGFIGEAIEAMEDTGKNGATKYIINRFYTLLQKWFHFHKRAWLTQEAIATSTILLIGLGNTVALLMSAYFWFQNEISIGTVYMIFFYMGLLSKPIEEISRQFEDLQIADASITRLSKLQSLRSKINDGTKEINSPSIALEFKNVEFAYTNKAMNLRNINFKLNSGEKLGLIGKTGSGKSTLAKLLLRLYDVNKGDILINNVSLTDIRIASLRKDIALVSQEIHIFDGTVRDNLTLFDPKYEDQTLINVLDHLELRSWFERLPNGLDTKISFKMLSLGEAQLFAFARVFLKNPKLIILDETSSKIDRYTEKKVQNALRKLIQDKTAIIIAHRLSTINNVDKILILEDGKIKEYGETLSLLNTKSYYKELLIDSGEEAF
ncbi:ABC transporter ATP-binding protein [Cytobacillus firmus]|uniref:ABC transporter ATP-binding protein n=1 Tax=Cytobacillus firmus TaxID=1399 RepID=UPI0030029157